MLKMAQAIQIELMKDYRYLSNLYAAKGDLYYTETMADMENNDYTQKLHRLNVSDKTDTVVYGPEKKVGSFALNDEVVIKKNSEGELIETVYAYLKDGNTEDFLCVPFAGGELKDFGDYYLLEGETDRRCPEYYRSSEQEKKTFHEKLKK